jgi:hypothetical protein
VPEINEFARSSGIRNPNRKTGATNIDGQTQLNDIGDGEMTSELKDIGDEKWPQKVHKFNFRAQRLSFSANCFHFALIHMEFVAASETNLSIG